MKQIPVLVDTFSTPGEIAAVESALDEIGIEGFVEKTVPPQGDGPWLVLIGMSAATFLNAFLGAAGKDAWEKFKAFFDQIRVAHEPKRRFWRRRRRPRFGQMVIRPNIETDESLDPSERAAIMMGWISSGIDGSTELMLSTDLPEEAFHALFELDLSAYPNHYLFWNPDRGAWDARAKKDTGPDPKDA
jgi:hypothetical protein